MPIYLNFVTETHIRHPNESVYHKKGREPRKTLICWFTKPCGTKVSDNKTLVIFTHLWSGPPSVYSSSTGLASSLSLMILSISTACLQGEEGWNVASLMATWTWPRCHEPLMLSGTSISSRTDVIRLHLLKSWSPTAMVLFIPTTTYNKISKNLNHTFGTSSIAYSLTLPNTYGQLLGPTIHEPY